MGADLIVHIAIVPNEITGTMRKNAQNRIDRLLEAADKQDKLVLPDRELRWEDLLPELQEVGKALEQEGDAYAAEDVTNCIRGTLREEKLLDNLVDVLTNGGYRDTVMRPMKPFDRRHHILVCGDMSWGDKPEGEGFRLLSIIYAYGFWQDFEVQ